MKVIETIAHCSTEVELKGWKLIDVRLPLHHDDEHFLYCVIENHKGEYVSYIFNSSSGSFQIGYYFDNKKEALNNMRERYER